jgi:hypothetical protein
VYTFVELKLILQYAFYFSIVAANDYNMLIIMASYCKLCGKDSKLAKTHAATHHKKDRHIGWQM